MTHGDYRECPDDAVVRAADEYRAELKRLTAELAAANQRADAAATAERERIVSVIEKRMSDVPRGTYNAVGVRAMLRLAITCINADDLARGDSEPSDPKD